MIKAEKNVKTTVTLTLDGDEASKLMSYLEDGPYWGSAPGGQVAEAVFIALNKAGIEAE